MQLLFDYIFSLRFDDLKINIYLSLVSFYLFACCLVGLVRLAMGPGNDGFQGLLRTGNLKRIFGKKENNTRKRSTSQTPPRSPRRKTKEIDANSGILLLYFHHSSLSSNHLTLLLLNISSLNPTRHSFKNS